MPRSPRALISTVCAAGLVAAATATPAPAAVAGITAFSSPSQNIGCVLTAQRARCDIKRKAWSPPPKPSGCELDYGQGLVVDRRSTRGRVVCAGDTALTQDHPLAYGRTVRRGSIRCTSRRTGVRCVNAGGHGFSISYQRGLRF